MASNGMILRHVNTADTRSARSTSLGYDQAMVLTQGHISWMGPDADLVAATDDELDLEGRWVTPGFIDPHTHLLYGGDRLYDFVARFKGQSYGELASRGSGIAATVRATRLLSEKDLVLMGKERLSQMALGGVTTVEIKSGYGLEPDTEERILTAVRELNGFHGIQTLATFLGAHALPPEFQSASDYLAFIVHDALVPLAHKGLIDHVDAFVDPHGFSPGDVIDYYQTARALSLPLKGHIGQFGDLGGAELLASYNALSGDHVDHISREGIKAMTHAGTAAVLTPGVTLTLASHDIPPIETFREFGTTMALATDCNPGTSDVWTMTAALHLGAALYRLTPEECLFGATAGAARALGLSDRGVLATGLRADLAIWDVTHPFECVKQLGSSRLHARIAGGLWWPQFSS